MRAAVGDDHVVRDGGFSGEIDGDKVFGLVVLQGGRDERHQLPAERGFRCRVTGRVGLVLAWYGRCPPLRCFYPGPGGSIHVLPALIRKFHEAKFNYHASVEIWGSGKPLREFLFVNDLAEACLFLLKLKDADYLPLVHTEDAPIINIGTGKETYPPASWPPGYNPKATSGKS